MGFVPALNRSAGGVYQYSATLMDALADIARQDRTLELVALVPEGVSEMHAELEARGWRVVPAAAPVGAVRGALRRIAGEGPHRDAWRWLRGRLEGRAALAPRGPGGATHRTREDLGAWWKAQGIELVIFPQPHPWSFEAGVPSIVAIHDLQHRLQPEFPEVSADGEWERREDLLRNCVAHTAAILVDSEVGRQHVRLFYGAYGASNERVHVLPFLPASTMPRTVSESASAAVRRRHGIPDAYIFYPAQFWSHKNHARIIESLEQIRNSEGLEIHAVFCGSHSGAERERHFAQLMSMAEQCGVSKQIHVLGFVSDDDLAALYAGARALVMPTFFGPTNIPVLEAWALNCPVLTSDIPGVREQAGDAALLVDPRRVDELAAGILQLWKDEELRRTLTRRGTERLASYGPAEFKNLLRAALQSARSAMHERR